MGGALGLGGSNVERPASELEAVLPDSAVEPLLAGLEQRSAVAPPERLGDGLLAPTNRWYSGLVFGDSPKPVFPLPLGFALTDSGYAFGVPGVDTAPGLITAPFSAQVALDLGATEHSITAYDDVSVSVTELRYGLPIGLVTIARGSPMVSFVAKAEMDIHPSVAMDQHPGGFFTATIGTQVFGLVTNGSVTQERIQLQAGEVANWFAVPLGTDPASLATLAESPLASVTTSWSGTQTTLDYETEAGGQTLIGVLPHQAESLATPNECSLGTFATVLGDLRLCAGTTLAWSVKAVAPSSTLNLDAISPEQRAELADQLGRDIATTPAVPGDTYFGGKALARLANLLELARALDETESEETLKSLLSEEIARWKTGEGCAERCFVYDPVIGGIVGEPAAFGSEEFNDHHFHYGYFLYAAAVLARDDEAAAERLTPIMTLLAADLASGGGGSYFPARRGFDPYSGHSWASGLSPFADGNNQESSSEAVSAWNGLALWAQAVGDEALESEAAWMLASEADSALRYWLDFDQDIAPWAGYDRSVVGIVWDGKVEYGTWFSADPGAILGIQLLPMQPVADYLRADPARMNRALEEAQEGSLFRDYLVMYSAIAGNSGVLDAARQLPESAIDDGNSRSYLLAWVMSNEG
jgi:endo-1,3(4)-beta-glucanase